MRCAPLLTVVVVIAVALTFSVAAKCPAGRPTLQKRSLQDVVKATVQAWDGGVFATAESLSALAAKPLKDQPWWFTKKFADVADSYAASTLARNTPESLAAIADKAAKNAAKKADKLEAKAVIDDQVKGDLEKLVRTKPNAQKIEAGARAARASRSKADKALAIKTKKADQANFFNLLKSNPDDARNAMRAVVPIADNATPDVLARSFREIITKSPKDAEAILTAQADQAAFHKFITDNPADARRLMGPAVTIADDATPEVLARSFNEILSKNPAMAKNLIKARVDEVTFTTLIKENPVDARNAMRAVDDSVAETASPAVLEQTWKQLLEKPSTAKAIMTARADQAALFKLIDDNPANARRAMGGVIPTLDKALKDVVFLDAVKKELAVSLRAFLSKNPKGTEAIKTARANHAEFSNFIKNSPDDARNAIRAVVPIADNATPDVLAQTFRNTLYENPSAVKAIMAARADQAAFSNLIKDSPADARNAMRAVVPIASDATPDTLAQTFRAVLVKNPRAMNAMMAARADQAAFYNLIKDSPVDARNAMNAVTPTAHATPEAYASAFKGILDKSPDVGKAIMTARANQVAFANLIKESQVDARNAMRAVVTTADFANPEVLARSFGNILANDPTKGMAIITARADQAAFHKLITNNPADARRLMRSVVTIADDATPEVLARSFNKMLSKDPSAAKKLMTARADEAASAFQKLITDNPVDARRLMGGVVPIADNATPEALTRSFEKMLTQNPIAARDLMTARADEAAFHKFIADNPADAARLMKPFVSTAGDATPEVLAQSFNRLLSENPIAVEMIMTARAGR